MTTATRNLIPAPRPEPPRSVGTVRWFDRRKSLGFLAPDDGSEALHFHGAAVRDRVTLALLETLPRVRYRADLSSWGLRAVDVEAVD